MPMTTHTHIYIVGKTGHRQTIAQISDMDVPFCLSYFNILPANHFSGFRQSQYPSMPLGRISYGNCIKQTWISNDDYITS